MKCGGGDEIKFQLSNAERVERELSLFNPFRVGTIHRKIFPPNFHSGLFLFNPFGIMEFKNRSLFYELQFNLSNL